MPTLQYYTLQQENFVIILFQPYNITHYNKNFFYKNKKKSTLQYYTLHNKFFSTLHNIIFDNLTKLHITPKKFN